MATISKKKNGSYLIRVYNGYDIEGRQIEHSTTFTPEPGMSQKQIEKALNSAMVLFENSVKNNTQNVNNQTFMQLAERWFVEQKKPVPSGAKKVKRKTLANYRDLSKRIYKAIGHIKVKKLSMDHLNAFYEQLQAPGIRRDIRYRPVVNLDKLIKEMEMKKTTIAKEIGVCANTMHLLAPTARSTRGAGNTTLNIAERVSSYLGYALTDLFEAVNNDNGLSDASVKRHHEFIATVLSWAVNNGELAYSICYRNAPVIADRAEAVFYNEEQVREFLESLDGADIRFAAVACIAFMMGLRRAEICGIDINRDINWTRKTLLVRQNSLYLPEIGVYDDTLKTPNSRRTLKMPDVVVKVLHLLKGWQKEQRKKLGSAWANSGKLITTNFGAPIHPDTVSKWMAKHREKHNLPYITLRGARHTNATLLIFNNIDIATVSRNLGHSRISTTLDTYTHAIVEAGQANVASLMDECYGNSVGVLCGNDQTTDQ